jgi:pyrroline-5-carboxylate reductase
MNTTQIGFIGGGNMAASLIGGLIADGWPADKIHVSDPDHGRRELLHSRFSVHSHDDNIATVQATDVLVLAVKPQSMSAVVRPLAAAIAQKQALLITIAAGINLTDLSRWCGDYTRLVRSMPNTPALVQSSATALYADPSVDAAGRDLAETIMRAVGLTLWVDSEEQIDAVTALSGSGPAYFFYIMEAIEEAGIGLGLSAKNARLLTLQTAFGAAKMALESADDPQTLRQKVTSPGGTTERALSELQQGDLKALLNQAIKAACERSQELAKELGQQA